MGGKNMQKVLVDVRKTILESYQVRRIVSLEYVLQNRALTILVSIEFMNGEILSDAVEVLNA